MALPSRFLTEIPDSLFKSEEKSVEEQKAANLEDGRALLERMRNKLKR